VLWLNWRDVKHPWAGGAEIHQHELAQRLAREGHRVTVFSSWHPGLDRKEQVGGYTIIRVGNNETYPLAVWRFLRVATDYDLIIENTNKVPLYTWVPLLLSKTRQLVAIVHHLNRRIYFRELPLGRATLAYLLESFMPCLYTRMFKIPIVTVSESSRKELVRLGSDPRLIKTIHCGVDHEKYRPLTPNIIEQKTHYPTVLFLNRLMKYKQPDEALKAHALVVRRVANAKLIIAGDGEMLSYLKLLAGRLNIADNVEFKGHISEEEKIRLFQQCWVCIQTSSKEGWSLSVTEAGACGTPTVGYRVCGLIDSIVDGKTGCLTDVQPRSLAEKLVFLLTDRASLESMGKSAREFAMNFQWNNACCQLLEVIEMIQNQSSIRGFNRLRDSILRRAE